MGSPHEHAALHLTQQGTGVQDLLAQTSHYSEKVRKHALVALGDVTQRRPAEVKAHAAAVIEALAARISDADAAVRSELHTLLQAVLPLLPSTMLGPFVPLLMAQISSAMTHMLLEIRTDALQYLDLFTQHSPAVIIAGHLDIILHHFCDVLSQVCCTSTRCPHSRCA